MSPGAKFRSELERGAPLLIPGTINAYSALLAERAGFRSVYVSGAGVANASFGLPDLGMTSLGEVAEDVRRISSATSLPVLVDVDTGFGGAFNIARTTREMIRAGAAAMHIEDQQQAKRCGHRPNKAIVSTGEMCDRLKAALDARSDEHFVVMARTDAFAREGLDSALERAVAYAAAGADMIFAEALTSIENYQTFCAELDVPVLANMTEFGVTPNLTVGELADAGISMILYPLSAFRAMSKAASLVYETILNQGTQLSVLETMQTREELYEVLDYHAYERKLDALFAQESSEEDS